MGWFKRKRAPAAGSDLTSARRAILRLAQSAADPELRRSAIRHLVDHLSDARKRTLKYGRSVDPGINVDPSTVLSQIEPSECTEDQDFLIEVAQSNFEGKDRVIATGQVSDQEALVVFAVMDRDDDVGLAALERIADQDLVFLVAAEAKSSSVAYKALDRIANPKAVKCLATKSDFWGMRAKAVERLDDPGTLAKIALRDADSSVRAAALDRVTNQSTLVRAARSDEEPYVRKSVVERIESQRVLAKIAVGDEDPSVRIAAIRRLSDERTLRKLADSDVDLDVREAAAAQSSDEAASERVAQARKTHQEETRRAVEDLARSFLGSLPICEDETACGASWHTGDRDDVIRVLDEYGRFDVFGEDDPETAWDRIAPSFCDPLTGERIDDASFLVDVESFQLGGEHFREITKLRVVRIGANQYAWKESGGTMDG